MTTVPERPRGAHEKPAKSTLTDRPRWAELGLADPLPDGSMPVLGSTADLLAWALVAPGADEPIAGIVDGVRVELEARASSAPALGLVARRLQVAALLLRRVDERAPMPPEFGPDAEENPDERPEPAPEEATETG